MPSLTIENYVKAIFKVAKENGAATTGKLAEELNVAPGTVTSMLKTLSDSELADYVPYEGVRLTASGKALALRVLRRHRLIELFLVKTLGFSWSEVHEEAENMEHAVSEYLVDRIDAYLGFPSVDPHGDPIPKSDGTIAEIPASKLVDVAGGSDFRIVRVLDQGAEFLDYLTANGLRLASRGKLIRKSEQAGTVSLEVNGVETTLGIEAASKILVTLSEES